MGRRTVSGWIIQGLYVYFKIASSPRREWRYNQEKTFMTEREIAILDSRSWAEICSTHSSGLAYVDTCW
jgi:hypothetical protein